MSRKTSVSYRITEGLCMLFALAFAVFLCYSNSPLFLDYGSDNPIFLTIGKGITLGKVPYVDLIENKGPLLFLLNGLPQYLVAGTTGVFILEALMALGACWLILRSARLLQDTRYQIAVALVPVAVYFGHLARTLSGGNFGEEYNVFLLVVAIWAFLRESHQTKPARIPNAFWLGVAFSGVALIKISDILGVAVTVLFYFLYFVRGKWAFWRAVGAFIGGAAVLAVPVFVYLWATNSVVPMFKEYILSNFTHISGESENSALAVRWQMLTRWDQYAILSVWPLGLALVAAVWNGFTGRRNPDKALQGGMRLSSYAIALALAAGASVYVSITGYGQHLIPLAAPLMLAALLLCAGITRWLATRGRLVRAMSLAAGVAAAAMIALSAMQNAYFPPFVNSEAYREDMAYQTEFAEYIGEDPDVVFCLGVPREWYCINDIIPAYKYINLISYIVNGVGTGCDVDFEQFIEEDEIEWLVVQGDLERFRGVLTDETMDYIWENYVLVTMDSKDERGLWELI